MRILKVLAVLVLLSSMSLNAQTKKPVVDYNTPKTYVIGDIRVEGTKYLSPERVVSLTGLEKGMEITVPSEEISSVIKRITMQRYFSDVSFNIDSVWTKDTITLGIHLTERPRVSKWDFSGIRNGEKKDLMERLKLKRGGELSEYGMKSSVDIIKRFFKEKGFLKTDVKVIQQTDTVIKNAVRVTFKITKGPRVKIGRIDIKGNVG